MEDTLLTELYIPRKCDATGTVIHAKDHASIQMNVCKLDKDGKIIKGEFETFSIVGNMRKAGKSDEIVNEICIKRKVMRNTFKNARKVNKPKPKVVTEKKAPAPAPAPAPAKN